MGSREQDRAGAPQAHGTVQEAVEESGFLELSITFRHAERVAGLPAHHRDPFDHLLVAQAEVEGLALVTRDPVFRWHEEACIEA